MSDTKELIERLQAFVALDGGDLAVVEQAADTIARLEAERDAARREAMEEAAQICEQSPTPGCVEVDDVRQSLADAIRAAMQGEEK